MEAGRAHAIPVLIQDGAHEKALGKIKESNYNDITIPYNEMFLSCMNSGDVQ